MSGPADLRVMFELEALLKGGERAAASCSMARVVVDDVEMELCSLSQPVADLKFTVGLLYWASRITG